MDFATEQSLCRLAHEVWRQLVAEPRDVPECAAAQPCTAEAGRVMIEALHLDDVFALDGHEMAGW